MGINLNEDFGRRDGINPPGDDGLVYCIPFYFKRGKLQGKLWVYKQKNIAEPSFVRLKMIKLNLFDDI